MRLVIGGAYQGKKEYIKRKYGIQESEIRQGEYPVLAGEWDSGWRCLCGLHNAIREIMQKSPASACENAENTIESYVNRTINYLSAIAERIPDLIILCDEVGNGVVPIEKSERDYRECVGRVLCILAEQADSVERVYCGVGQMIKNTVSITFIRHGSTPGNRRKQYIGVTDESLCAEGREALLSRRMQGIYPRAARVIASPMKRCLETAQILYPDIAPEVYPEFRETDFGLFEGKSYEALMGSDSLRPSYQEWLDSNGVLCFPEGESMEQTQKRCAVGFERLLPTLTSDAVVIAHGGTIMSLLYLYAEPQKGYYDYQCGNGAGFVCRVELTGDGRLHRMRVDRKLV